MTTTTATQLFDAGKGSAGWSGGNAMQRRRQLLRSVESLRGRVCQVLKCVINLHIEFLVLESNVAVLLEEVRCLNADYAEVQRLDCLIDTLRNYNGPTVCHEWPYPLIFQGTIDEAHVAQILNTTESAELRDSSAKRTKYARFTRTRSATKKANVTINNCGLPART